MLPQRRRPALFLDRDGVLIENRPDYVRAVADIIFIPGGVEALAEFARAQPETSIIIASNQAGIGRGLIARETVEAINTVILERVRSLGGRIDAIYLCPHRADEACICRKPKPGMLLQAADELGLDLRLSSLIGDSASDVEAALAAGGRPIFVQSGLAERLPVEQAKALHLGAGIHAHLAEALQAILAEGAANRALS